MAALVKPLRVRESLGTTHCVLIFTQAYKGDPKMPRHLFTKKLFIHSYMLKLQSPSRYSPSDAIHLLRSFLHSSKQFLTSATLMPLSVSAVFVSPHPHWQDVSLGGRFHSGKQANKKAAQGEIG